MSKEQKKSPDHFADIRIMAGAFDFSKIAVFGKLSRNKQGAFLKNRGF